MLVEVSVAGLALDPRTESPILLLRDGANNRVLPIWIGVAEATAIAAQVEGIELPRPMTHDLTQTMIASLGGHISRVAITSLVDATFYAQIVLAMGTDEREVDARPSDAVALALRAQAPIFVDDQVFVDGSAVVIDAGAMDQEVAAAEHEEAAAASAGLASAAPGDDAVAQTPAERWTTLLDHMNQGDGEKN